MSAVMPIHQVAGHRDAGHGVSLAAGLALALPLFILGGCGDASTQSSGLQSVTTQNVSAMITQIQTAPFVTPHEGVRKIERYFETLGTPGVLVYTEEIVTDGQGNYSIEPLEAQTPVPSGFLALQKRREGFFYLYRDFLVRDANLFLDNYQITDAGPDGTGTTVFVAGRECREFEAQRIGSSGHAYTVAFDLATGIVLRYEERDPQGTLLSSMVYESFDGTPDLSGVDFHQPSNAKQPIDLSADVDRQLGFDPLVPTWTPSGYQLSDAARLEDALGETWFQLAYSDGVETLFFLHTDRPEDAGTQKPIPKSFGLKQPMVWGGDASSPDGGDGSQGSRVYTAEVGPLSVVQGVIDQRQVIAVGKVPTDDLLEMIESALD